MTFEQKEWIKANSYNHTAAQIVAITGATKKEVYYQLVKKNLPFIRLRTINLRMGLIKKQAPYYTAKELAAKFGVSYPWMRALLAKNNIKAKSGRYWERKTRKK